MCFLVYSLPSALDFQLSLDKDRARGVHTCALGFRREARRQEEGFRKRVAWRGHLVHTH